MSLHIVGLVYLVVWLIVASEEGTSQQVEAIRRDGSREAALSKLEMPVLVLHGHQDELVPISHGEQTAKVIPHAKYVTGEASHVPRAHEADLFHDSIISFLNEI